MLLQVYLLVGHLDCGLRTSPSSQALLRHLLLFLMWQHMQNTLQDRSCLAVCQSHVHLLLSRLARLQSLPATRLRCCASTYVPAVALYPTQQVVLRLWWELVHRPGLSPEHIWPNHKVAGCC